MPVNPTYPGIYIEELPSAARTITAAPTSVTVFIGYTHPFKTKDSDGNANFGNPVRVFSFSDYERMFGGLYRSDSIDNSVAYAVQQFFLNGGADAYVVGLQPKFWSPAMTSTPYPQATCPVASSLTLKAIEPTDAVPMSITMSNKTSTTKADLTITYGGRVETYRGVTLSGVGKNVEELLGSSSLVEFVEASDYGTYSLTEKALTSFTYTAPDPSWTAKRSADFTDLFDEGEPLDKVDIFNLMVIPGVSDNSVLTGAQAFCEKKRAFLIMDAPDDYTVDALVQSLGGNKAMVDSIPTSPNSALYMPYLQGYDPLRGETVPLPPSGYAAGVFSRTDTNRGVWKAPAGLETVIKNTTGVVADGRMTDMQAGMLNKNMINAIRTFPGVGTVTFGARTYIGSNPAFDQWRYIPVRRMALFIEQTLYSNLGWVVFEPNDEPLWSAIRTSIDQFMLSLFKQGAFQGSKPSDAFLVKCDSSTTTQYDIDNGRVNILVGFRPLKPAEFVVVQITQLAGQAQA